MKSVFLLFGLLVVCVPVLGKSLCEPEDKIVFSCEIENKIVSVCMTLNETVRYTYGTEDKVELELNSPVFSSAACSGGGISRLRFNNGNYSYIVYDVICNSSRISEDHWSKADFSGLIVLSNDRIIFNKECTDFDDSVFGVNSGILPKSVEEENFNYEIP